MVEIAMRRQGARLIPVDNLSADDLVRVPADRDVMVKITSHRNMKLFRFLWALASKVADACDHLHDREDAMDELKIRVRHVKYITNPATGEVQIVPKSLTKLDGPGLSRLADRMIFVICRDIVPGLSEETLRAEIMAMIEGNNSNSSQATPQASPTETDKPASASAVDAGNNSGSAAGQDETADSEARAGDNSISTGSPSLPMGWEITYAAALRRAQKPESLSKYASQYWDQYGGWPAHKDSSDGTTAAAIYNVFKDNFGRKDVIEVLLRELI